ncbi:MAG: NTP transferase domain-containing protein [Bacteroidales bacterium]|jgi:NDP-sugar pyrophosphorylase family protein|nr:NTP transferase domain-containing protein [Bacteroidales bacterium]
MNIKQVEKQAMIFAAGNGSRLGKYTQNQPKALVKIGGKTLLENVIEKMIATNVTYIVINIHHFADKIADFVKKSNFNAKIKLSFEAQLLDTGGGLKKAAPYFDTQKPVILYNTDIVSNIDLEKMYSYHIDNQLLATLAVRLRQTERYFLFDDQNCFCGTFNRRTNEKQLKENISSDISLKHLAFSGIHIISPKIFTFFPKKDIFSIKELYFAAPPNCSIKAYPHDKDTWEDVGKIETLERFFLECRV